MADINAMPSGLVNMLRKLGIPLEDIESVQMVPVDSDTSKVKAGDQVICLDNTSGGEGILRVGTVYSVLKKIGAHIVIADTEGNIVNSPEPAAMPGWAHDRFAITQAGSFQEVYREPEAREEGFGDVIRQGGPRGDSFADFGIGGGTEGEVVFSPGDLVRTVEGVNPPSFSGLVAGQTYEVENVLKGLDIMTLVGVSIPVPPEYFELVTVEDDNSDEVEALKEKIATYEDAMKSAMVVMELAKMTVDLQSKTIDEQRQRIIELTGSKSI